MATACCGQPCRPIRRLSAVLRRPPATPKPAGVALGRPRPCSKQHAAAINGRASSLKWAVWSSLAERRPPKEPDLDVKGLVDFLYEDLPHLFDDQGIDRTMYDDRVRFRDPITKHDTIDGYLFNIRLLKELFRPDFQLHRVWQCNVHEGRK